MDGEREEERGIGRGEGGREGDEGGCFIDYSIFPPVFNLLSSISLRSALFLKRRRRRGKREEFVMIFVREAGR